MPLSRAVPSLLLLFTVAAAFDLDQFGAVRHKHSSEVAVANSAALHKAFLAATEGSDRTVVVPEGTVYYIQHVPTLTNITDVTFIINGTLVVDDTVARWPMVDSKHYADVFTFVDTERLTISGHGRVEGQGYVWWEKTILGKIVNKRPDLFTFNRARDLVIEGVTVRNSPRFHFAVKDCDVLVIRHIDITVDIVAQKKLLSRHGHWDWLRRIPLFPLNTDGIDPSGRNIHIHDVKITNHDDAVAVKPSNGGHKLAQCSENILVERAQVNFGVGMTIGSVPPNDKSACVRDVTFRHISFHHPYKAIYIKTNPGNTGDGLIDNITYENIKINNAIWWAVYIGPQQQKQPDGSGPGCMLYPIDPRCNTQPRITISNITLRDIRVEGSILPPGIIRCHSDNPCRNIVFDNVHFTGLMSHVNFICENAQVVSGPGKHNSYPFPKCRKVTSATSKPASNAPII